MCARHFRLVDGGRAGRRQIVLSGNHELCWACAKLNESEGYSSRYHSSRSVSPTKVSYPAAACDAFKNKKLTQANTQGEKLRQNASPGISQCAQKP